MGNESHDFLPEMGDQEGPQPGPSWGNPKWLAEGPSLRDWVGGLSSFRTLCVQKHVRVR